MGALVIGGKSMGGRVASMVADQLYASPAIAGLLCLGYPFHPLGRNRIGASYPHLEALHTPHLICRGRAIPLARGRRSQNYAFPKAIEIVCLPDGDHELKPRKRGVGLLAADHLRTMANRVATWTTGLIGRGR